MKTLEKRLYDALNSLAEYCGGIENFITNGRDDAWKAKGYHDIFACCLGDRRVMVGYQHIISGDVVSDPGISVTLTGHGTADLDSIVIDTLLPMSAPVTMADIEYVVGVIERMGERLKSGRFTMIVDGEG